MKEYEYSFNVESIKPYIEYCEKNGYKKVSQVKQNRVVYENKNMDKIISRMTTKFIDDKPQTVLDFKNFSDRHNSLQVPNESLPIEVTEQNRSALESALEVLDFYVSANNFRTRYEYEKDGVLFEIDDYSEPKMQVVAIEGEKEFVDRIYAEIKDIK